MSTWFGYAYIELTKPAGDAEFKYISTDDDTNSQSSKRNKLCVRLRIRHISNVFSLNPLYSLETWKQQKENG